MTDPVQNTVRNGVKNREHRVTISLRVPARIKKEVARIGKRRYETMSTCAASLLIDAVNALLGRVEGR